MKLYNEFDHHVVELDNSDYLVSKFFATQSVDSSLDIYSKRNQKNRSTIINQILQGKLAEFAIYHFCEHCGYKASRPDTKVYEKKDKSFEPDLLINDSLYLEVKSISSAMAKRCGLSFQFASWYDKKVVIAMVEVQNKTKCLIRGFMNSQDVVFGEPMLERLIGIKKTLYVKDQDPNAIRLFPFPLPPLESR